MAYEKEFLDALRKVPVCEVFAVLGLEPVQTRNGKPVKTAFDACFCAGMTYKEAQDFLASHFSGAAEADTVKKQAAALLDGCSFTSPRMRKIGQEIALFMAALGADALSVQTNVHESLKEAGLYNFTNENMSFDDIANCLNILAKLSFSGKPGIAPVGIYCQPIYSEGKIGIMIDDVHGDIINKYKPTVLLQTSLQGKPQAFYVVTRKHELSFYNYVAAKLNEQYGDRAVKSVFHDTRLPGFHNQKRAESSPVKVLSYTIDSSEFEQFIETFMDDYIREGKETAYIVSHQSKSKILGASDLERIYKYIEKYCAENGLDKREMTSIWGDSLSRFEELYSRDFQYISYPEQLKEVGRRELTKLMGKYADDFDRSRADYKIARVLYTAGATVDEVYSYFIDNLVQKNLELVDKVSRIRSEKELKRQAKRLAVKAAPVWVWSLPY